MDIIRDQLENMVKQLEKMRQIYNEELATSPPGRLINNRTNDRPAFFRAEVIYDRNGSRKYRRKYLPPGHHMINELARKEYLTKILKRINSNMKSIQHMIKHYVSLDPAEIMGNMGRAYRLLESQSFFCNEERDLYNTVHNIEELTDEMIAFRCELHMEWAAEDYNRNTIPFPEEKYLTGTGRRVRSRGEIIICDRLDHFGIPYRYDQVLHFDDGSSLSPDFTFQNKYYEEFYLEYCGMMDDPDYVGRHLYKRAEYEHQGIFPWKNINYIYSVDSGISVPEIDSVIKNYVIPRM